MAFEVAPLPGDLPLDQLAGQLDQMVALFEVKRLFANQRQEYNVDRLQQVTGIEMGTQCRPEQTAGDAAEDRGIQFEQLSQGRLIAGPGPFKKDGSSMGRISVPTVHQQGSEVAGRMGHFQSPNTVVGSWRHRQYGKA